MSEQQFVLAYFSSNMGAEILGSNLLQHNEVMATLRLIEWRLIFFKLGVCMGGVNRILCFVILSLKKTIQEMSMTEIRVPSSMLL